MTEQEKLREEAEMAIDNVLLLKSHLNYVGAYYDVVDLLTSFAAKKLEEQRANADMELSDDEIKELASRFYGVLAEDLPPFDKDKGFIFLRACAQYREALKSKLTNKEVK